MAVREVGRKDDTNQGWRSKLKIGGKMNKKTFKKVKPCPFCGGTAKPHPTHPKLYVMVYHKKGCYMDDDPIPDYRCTLLNNFWLKIWNKRTGQK